MLGAQVPTLLSDLAENRGVSRPFFRFSNLLQQLTELRETVYLIYQFIIKDESLNSTMEETPAEGTGGAWRVPAPVASLPAPGCPAACGSRVLCRFPSCSTID